MGHEQPRLPIVGIGKTGACGWGSVGEESRGVLGVLSFEQCLLMVFTLYMHLLYTGQKNTPPIPHSFHLNPVSPRGESSHRQ